MDRLSPAIPLELLEYGPAATLTRLRHVWLRDAPRSPDGGVVDDPVATAARLSSTTRLIERGLFAPGLVPQILEARGERVDRITTP